MVHNGGLECCVRARVLRELGPDKSAWAFRCRVDGLQFETIRKNAKKIEKIESKIDWNLEAKHVVAKINALYPNPGSWFELKGSRIKVIKAIEVNAKATPGEIISKDFIIGCSQNAIQILELKKEGKNKISAKEFLKGNKLEVGSNINIDV